MLNRKKAFTLTELLVVVIVLGALATVAVPKFTRVLETRRTGEAESMLTAVRMEQEKRCTLGQNYTGDFSKMPTVAFANRNGNAAATNNYNYTLTATGVTASRPGKDYVLKIPSYKTGEICCEGAGCTALNKSYPTCSGSASIDDNCAVPELAETEPSDPCDLNPNSCECSSYASSHRCECDADYAAANRCICDAEYASANACECHPSSETCCGPGERWDPQSKVCQSLPTCENPGYAEAHPCECDASYASAHKCECDANYASAHKCECSPSTENCCSEGQEWNPNTKQCEDVEEEEDCPEGFVWDEATGECVMDCQYDMFGWSNLDRDMCLQRYKQCGKVMVQATWDDAVEPCGRCIMPECPEYTFECSANTSSFCSKLTDDYVADEKAACARGDTSASYFFCAGRDSSGSVKNEQYFYWGNDLLGYVTNPAVASNNPDTYLIMNCQCVKVE